MNSLFETYLMPCAGHSTHRAVASDLGMPWNVAVIAGKAVSPISTASNATKKQRRPGTWEAPH